MSYNYQACALEPKNHNYWSPECPRAGAQQQEKPLQWEAWVPQLESSLLSLQLEKSPHSDKTQYSQKINKSINKIIK